MYGQGTRMEIDFQTLGFVCKQLLGEFLDETWSFQEDWGLERAAEIVYSSIGLWFLLSQKIKNMEYQIGFLYQIIPSNLLKTTPEIYWIEKIFNFCCVF